MKYQSDRYLKFKRLVFEAHDHMLLVKDRTATVVIRLNTAMEDKSWQFWQVWPPLEMPCEFGVGIEPG